MIDLIPVVLYGMVFGWLGPEVIPRVIPGSLRAVVVATGYPFALVFLYWFLETINPSLSYPTLNAVNVILLSYIACYAMLVSRCTLTIKNVRTNNLE